MSRNKKGKKARTAHQRPQAQKTLAESIAQSAPAELAALTVGDRVSHPQFGVIAIDASKLSIGFASVGQKQIIDSSAHYLTHGNRAQSSKGIQGQGVSSTTMDKPASTNSIKQSLVYRRNAHAAVQ